MKHNFMNKENGKIASVLAMYLDDDGHMQTDSYDKVEDLLEDYAAYECAPKEPLIKDEKIRKAVRAWAEFGGTKTVLYCNTFENWGLKPADDNYCDILFRGDNPYGLEHGKIYTIEELCGEEEE